ncbi:hypothetical protein K469DRAFT_697626 [Zopfia rhizophila CBS 207.26]|uniref:Apple domain-containing protein n=1 Tax=Zopfia rhizophila CBS 207.26 TaxID=1314779 RepID=A0A6A6DH60_9PEZI|nr:hypothetical protein K469DRAFT_697626 [Zopfia rhizophila CBS 207.26]
MYSYRTFLLALPFAVLLSTKPLDAREDVARQADPTGAFYPCTTCLRGSWTQGPECTPDPGSNLALHSMLSRITNPPPEATSTYTPTAFCSEHMRPIDLTVPYEYWTGVSTYTSKTYISNVVTVTDMNHPTSTKYCAIPSPKMECGWNSNVSRPIEQEQDWSINPFYNNPQECHQVCLEHPRCRAYRVARRGNLVWSCDIYNKGLGENASMLVSSSRGTQWYDRNCDDHAPTECISGTFPTGTLETRAEPAQFRQPLITPAAQPVAREAQSPALVKRDVPPPPYMSDIDPFESFAIVSPACSCLITSGAPESTSTSTATISRFTSTKYMGD